MVGVCAGFIDSRTGSLNQPVSGTLAVYPPVSSPPPTPSLGLGGTSSQVDELFPPSPTAVLGDVPSILELESFKMGKSMFSPPTWLAKIDTA